MTCCLPCTIFLASPLSRRHIQSCQSLLELHRQPQPSPTDSLGPPLLSAMMGTPMYMASTGTMPKCQLEGVQSTHSARLSRYLRVSLLTAVQKWTRGRTSHSTARAYSSALCSMFSGTAGSQPPAITRSTRCLPDLSQGWAFSSSAQAYIASPMFFLRSQRLREKKYGAVSYFLISSVDSSGARGWSNWARSIAGQSILGTMPHLRRMGKLMAKTSWVKRLLTYMVLAQSKEVSSHVSMKKRYTFFNRPPCWASSLSGQWQQKMVLKPNSLSRGSTTLTWSATTTRHPTFQPQTTTQNVQRRVRMQASAPFSLPLIVSGSRPPRLPCSWTMMVPSWVSGKDLWCRGVKMWGSQPSCLAPRQRLTTSCSAPPMPRSGWMNANFSVIVLSDYQTDYLLNVGPRCPPETQAQPYSGG